MPDRTMTQFIDATTVSGSLLIPIVDTSEFAAENRNKKLTIEKLFTPPKWNNLTLLNGWTSVAGYATAQFRKLITKQIEIKGAIAKSGSPATSEIVANLPLEYRPSERRRFASTSDNSGVLAHTIVEIDPEGNILFIAGGNSNLSLEIVFST